MLRAHAFMRTEAPPEPWTPEADDETFLGLLAEMIVAGLVRGNDLTELTLSAANVVVEQDPADDEAQSTPPGEFVAFIVSGGGEWTPERTWSPDRGANPPPFVTDDLEAAAVRAGAAYGYTRATDGGGAVVVWFRRAD
jgi:hypothetical protein